MARDNDPNVIQMVVNAMALGWEGAGDEEEHFEWEDKVMLFNQKL